ncbi:MAG: carboxypeptidase-like regulatory domain-containing protein [Saprospiraceae bacterium]
MKNFTLLLFLSLLSSGIYAQTAVSGNISDSDGIPLIGATVSEKGTTHGTVTDFDGNFSLNVSSINATLVSSYTGFATIETALNGSTNVSIVMTEGVRLGDVQITGSRSYRRSATTTPVAVDIIDVQEIAARNGNAELNKILQYLAPSFNAQKQSGSDGAEHIDPASLR